jgi:hypothetical protein
MAISQPALDDRYLAQQRRLRRFHDVMAQTPLAERYWFSGGALLGWAREGRLLSHDALDVDFHYLASDEERLRASLPILAQAGFRTARRFPNVREDVEPTQWALIAEDAIFDFFRIEDRGDHFRSHSYGGLGVEPTENVLALPAQPLEDFSFLGRRWLKPADHEAELTALYGTWRIPDPHFDYMQGAAIVQRRPWDLDGGFELH